MNLSPAEINKRLESFKNASRTKRLPLTPQKIAIFKILASSCSHPDAQKIYETVKKTFPSISLATVYKNLINFRKLGLIKEISVAGAPSKYDAKLENHSHAIFLDSGEVYDLGGTDKQKYPKKIMGKTVKRIEVTYYL